MSIEGTVMTHELYDYFRKTSLREPAILQKLREETANLPGAIMQISPEAGQLMGLLVELIGAKKTIDIGTFTGYSALIVAMALPPEGKVVSCDIDVNATNVAKKYWQEAGMTDKISLHLGAATETLSKLIENGEEGTFDFVFIDADKNNYDTYYEMALKLLRKGGLIAIDNVFWDGKVADLANKETTTESIRTLNEKLLHDYRVSISMVPIADGVTLVRKQ